MENPKGGDSIPMLDKWRSGFMKGVRSNSTGRLYLLRSPVFRRPRQHDAHLHDRQLGYLAAKKNSSTRPGGNRSNHYWGAGAAAQHASGLVAKQRRAQLRGAACADSAPAVAGTAARRGR
jgi:hypothetical protein